MSSARIGLLSTNFRAGSAKFRWRQAEWVGSAESALRSTELRVGSANLGLVSTRLWAGSTMFSLGSSSVGKAITAGRRAREGRLLKIALYASCSRPPVVLGPPAIHVHLSPRSQTCVLASCCRAFPKAPLDCGHVLCCGSLWGDCGRNKHQEHRIALQSYIGVSLAAWRAEWRRRGKQLRISGHKLDSFWNMWSFAKTRGVESSM